ncbi:MAG: hypothetical protein AAF798_21895 [Bacteroidota bacterium]
MRSLLQKFTTFTSSLLPSETSYLLSIQRFEDKERLQILRRVHYNAEHADQFTPYDTSINKRKYNHLQNWIADKLKAVDVDEQFNEMLSWEQKIMNDSIQPEEEKKILKTIRNYRHPIFFFSKFYELVEHYRHFLLLRLRYTDHQLADTFVKTHRAAYLQARQTKEQLHEAALDIVAHYSSKHADSRQWQGWLAEIFYNEHLEGQIRYQALVQLTFICHNYRNYDILRSKFDYLDQQFAKGLYYSKRLLVNYYSNRLMLHSNFREYDKALYYGYLSIRAKTHDFLFYVNNLCAVLLRLKRHQEALQLLQNTSAEAKKTKNFHNRIGFVAFYMEALIKNGLSKNAVNYGTSFLKAYHKEVLQFRWHLFFSVYLEALFSQKQFECLLRAAKKYRLQERDKSYRQAASYLPTIPIYIKGAQLREGIISEKQFAEAIQKTLSTTNKGQQKQTKMQPFLNSLQHYLPELQGQITFVN